MKRLAIATPTYNEKENIKDIIGQVNQVARTLDVRTTMFIIDDNSPDGTGKIANQLTGKYSGGKFQLEVIHRTGKLGLASAYIDAFNHATSEGFDYILSMDADLSHKPEYLPDFLNAIKKYDLVIGSRNIRGGGVENWSTLRKIISKGGSLYARIILGADIKDFTGGYNMYRKETLEGIGLNNIESEGYSFQIEMKYRAAQNGFSYTEIPIIFPDRLRNKSKMSSKIFLEALVRMWQLRFSNVTNNET